MGRDQLKELISQYVDGLETNLTQESCLCEWIEKDTAFGKRKVHGVTAGGDVNLECPVHTKEGLILAFVEKHLWPAERDSYELQ